MLTAKFIGFEKVPDSDKLIQYEQVVECKSYFTAKQDDFYVINCFDSMNIASEGTEYKVYRMDNKFDPVVEVPPGLPVFSSCFIENSAGKTIEHYAFKH
jgi:hypothetical protein